MLCGDGLSDAARAAFLRSMYLGEIDVKVKILCQMFIPAKLIPRERI
mgnify:CR=1 FL=1